MSRVHLIDRFSLSVWITRRIVPLADIPLQQLSAFQAACSEGPSIPSDLPGLLVAWEQRDCCLRLSDAKVAAVRQCLLAATLATSNKQSDLPSSATSNQQQRKQGQQDAHLFTRLRTESSRRRRALFSTQRRLTQSICFGDLPPSEQSMLHMRRRIVVTFSMQELTLQLDSKGACYD